jgi:hypothetical protein
MINRLIISQRTVGVKSVVQQNPVKRVVQMCALPSESDTTTFLRTPIGHRKSQKFLTNDFSVSSEGFASGVSDSSRLLAEASMQFHAGISARISGFMSLSHEDFA